MEPLHPPCTAWRQHTFHGFLPVNLTTTHNQALWRGACLSIECPLHAGKDPCSNIECLLHAGMDSC
eukprot:1144653-Pelagomonas_calceolata.AAC.1